MSFNPLERGMGIGGLTAACIVSPMITVSIRLNAAWVLGAGKRRNEMKGEMFQSA